MALKNKNNLLRLGVFIIVALTVVKYFSKGRPPPDLQSVNNIVEIAAPLKKDNLFWGEEDSPVIADKRDFPPEPPNELNVVVEDQKLPEKKKGVLKDFSAIQLRLVHLDLKGAAPKVSYFEQLFPLLSKLGANGLLIEYEDMFPFSGELQGLKSEYAYSKEDVEKILHLAELNKLEVVPLIQTFGHMEYVLKHNHYKFLREVEQYPNSINPHREETMPLLKKILTQVLDMHPMASFLHIGADEVFHLGEGQDSKSWMNSNNGDLGKMFLNHIKVVADFLKRQYPDKYLIMWDDMLRKIDVETIKEAKISQYVSPVLWKYRPDIRTEEIEQLLSRYQDCGFTSIWFASAFKGASEPDQIWTPIKMHMDNHLSWKKIIDSMNKFPKIRYSGIALTGWQRYDHYSVLCELLPVAIPSLAICLRAVRFGPLNEDANKEITQLLGFSKIDIENNICEGNGAFPGAEIYTMVYTIHSNLKLELRELMEGERDIRAWFSRYNRKHQFANPHKMEKFGTKLFNTRDEWENQVDALRTQLEIIYFPDTVGEWMEENINVHLDPLREMVKDFEQIIALKAQPKSMLRK